MPLDQTARTPFTKVGTRPLRPDGVDKVTGRARFGADMNAPGYADRPDPAQPARACANPLDR
jgi:CO/xanthine dehydrogenase Mo-binding subunit